MTGMVKLAHIFFPSPRPYSVAIGLLLSRLIGRVPTVLINNQLERTEGLGVQIRKTYNDFIHRR